MVYKNHDETTGNIDSKYDTYNTQNSPSQSNDFLTAQPTEAEQINFLAEIKQLTKNFGFILGCLLITVGALGGSLLNFTWLSILDIAFAAIYITALWILVFAAFSDTAYTKVLTALSMFRVSAVLTMVLVCILFALLAIVGFSAAMGGGLLFVLVFVICGGIGYILIRYYFLALLKVLSGIKERIITGTYSPLKGLRPFLLVSYISIAASIIISLVSIDAIIHPQNATETILLINLINAANTDASVAIGGFIFLVAYSAGIILCLRTLKKFENVT